MASIKYENPKMKSSVSGLISGMLTLDTQITDLSDGFISAAVLTSDVVQIGVIPRGMKLVSHLSNVSFPIMDATGTNAIGDAGTANSLLAAVASASASTKALVTGVELGSNDADTPLFLTVAGTVTELPTTGKIRLRLALRPYDAEVD